QRVVDVDAGRAQLRHGLERLTTQARLLPRPGGHPEHGQLRWFERDVGQAVIVAPDAVARLVIENAVAARLERDAQVAQIFLVALVLRLDRLVPDILVPGYGRPALFC